MTQGIKYPYMRAEIVGALRELGDPVGQQREWGRADLANGQYIDFSIVVHILYDDTSVLPDPTTAIGSMLFQDEVESLLLVEEVLGPLLDDLGDVPDERYLGDERWPAVTAAAARAAALMGANDGSGDSAECS